MAIYRLSAQIISRSTGSSAVFAAAYRAGERLRDERLGLTISYERKLGVDHKEILAPEGAPAWVFDRHRLWNAVEAREKLATSQVAREIQIALPSELSPDAQLELTRAFIREQFVARGMVADFAIHREHDDNPHVHVMLTMRNLGPEGFGTKNTRWNDPAMLLTWRESWAAHVNLALARAGVQQRVDHRSYEAQGIDLEPQPKIFRRAAEAHLDGRDHVLDRLVEYQQTVRRNGDRIIARPEIVLELLEARQSTFTTQDIQRLVHRQTADAAQFEKAMSAVRDSRALVKVDTDDGPELFTTRDAKALESALVEDGTKLNRRRRHVVSAAVVDQAILTSPKALNEEQILAVRQITMSGDLALVEGYAGTGKSTMLAAARAAWEARGYRVVGGALAGKAAEGLQESSGIESRTLASWQYGWEQGRNKLRSTDVLVLDEAGMIGTRQLAEIVHHVGKAGAKLVLVGDTKQLRAIEPGAPMRLFAQRFGAARLENIQRQRAHAWQREASLKFANFKTTEAVQAYVEQGRVHGLADAEAARGALVEAWQRDRLADPTGSSLLMAFRRKDVHALNEAARAIRIEAGELGEGHLFATRDGERQFAEGDRIYFLKNERALDVTNGTLGTIQAVVGKHLIVELDSKRQVVVDTRTYKALDHGYAGTIHKGQGVTVDRGYVLASKYLDASATYVAMTRHVKDAQLFYSQQEFSTPERLLRSLSRVTRTRMIHELSAPAVMQEAREIDRSARIREAFFALSPEARAEKLHTLHTTATAPTTSPQACLHASTEVMAAAERQTRAAAEHAAAERALREFSEAHPIKVRLGAAEYRALGDRLEQAERTMAEADVALSQLRRDPVLLARAARAAEKHNRSRQAAHAAWRKLSDLARDEQRRSTLERYVSTANTHNGTTKFRTTTGEDIGKTFTLVARRTIAGEPITILRDAGGRLVVLDALQAPKGLAPIEQGTSVTLQSRGRLVEHTQPHVGPQGRGL